MAEWSTIAESKASYTDNVTNFSAARRLKFSEDPSQPTGLPSQLSDVIWDPSLEVLRSSSSTLRPNELSIKAHGFADSQLLRSCLAHVSCPHEIEPVYSSLENHPEALKSPGPPTE
jgi:hypothetical protein